MFKNFKLTDLTDINKLRGLYNKYKPKIKKYALPLVVLIALLVFWATGNKTEIQADAITDLATNTDECNEFVTNFEEIYVDISGEIINPGVYKVHEGDRVFQVIEMAGGLTENADTTTINQAETVFDGEKIIVPKVGEDEGYSTTDGSAGLVNGKVNINKADLTTLETLPGIGVSKAQKIIDYRNSNGKFKKISDIKNVSGIGDATFDSLKDLICV